MNGLLTQLNGGSVPTLDILLLLTCLLYYHSSLLSLLV